MARCSKRTPERVEKILTAIGAGTTRKAAAAYAGIDLSTLERWERRFADFADAVRAREAASEVSLVDIVRQAGSQDWRAAAWLLERRWPESYGRQDRIELSIRQQAERLALGLGLDAAELIAEAERIASSHGR